MRGGRTRGGENARGARGGGSGDTGRPSVLEPMSSLDVSEVPQGSGQERPLHAPKRPRILRSATVTNIREHTGALSTADDAGPPSVPIDIPTDVPSSLPPPDPAPGLEELEASSPALYLECGGSGVSTPRAAGSGPLTPRGDTRRSLLERPNDHEIMEHLFYGSEEDSSEEEEDGDALPMPIPRTVRAFLEDEFRGEEGAAPAALDFSWPPTHFTPSVEPPSPTVQMLPAVPVLQPAVPEPAVPEPEVPSASFNLDKFDFQWRAFTQPQIAPELRRETFSEINCGPTTPYATPYDAFVAIWDQQIMEHIVVETNLYAQQLAAIMIQSNTMCPSSRITKWVDTTVDELYVYFAITLVMGIVVKSRIEEYWNCSRDIFCTPEFPTAMSCDRFLLLSRCLHFQDNAFCNPGELTRAQAKLFKIQPIVDHLNIKFSHLYTLDRNVVLDESLTMWKGWLAINQFIENKAAAVGIKSFELCESKTGYLWRFEVCSGHEEALNAQASPVSGIIPSIVLRLLKGLEHRGHTVWMDNYYNSPALSRELKCRGFDCVGTLRTNRPFVPTELMHLSKGNRAVGQVCGCTSGDVDLIVWRDKNSVALTSTYHGLATVKCGATLKPTVIADYNLCMGGVDRKDKMLAMYPLERKRTSVWYKKLFRRLLNVSTLNAYILYKSQQSTTHRSFRKTLVKELLSRHSPQPRPTPTITHHTETVRNTQGFKHYLKQYTALETSSHRRNCAECGKRVTSYCNGCEKALCVFSCFEPYHTKLFRNTTQ
ncbi:piggyBac transposable element-derived protein 4-like [Ostrinia furnacalis]|uniref:piggyBac transposable element-derived protein 4-like n=1 Tax=Ostrinia furnacalis TaxID=93504 RepID=UPI00103C5DCE|nr:piggyBac transposable element-derived protein 4-like [Ostrinia furnacalis]